MGSLSRRERLLAIGLRWLGGLDLLALLAVVMPSQWMNLVAIRLGLNPLPFDPVVGYLARSAALMYALHGTTVLFVSFDVQRYWHLIRFLALVAIVHGVIILGIDIAEEMPMWWRCVEGPCFSLTGIVVLCLMRR